MTTTEASIKAMTDNELSAFILFAQAEHGRREQHRKDEAIAKIRALAGDAGILVSIAGARGKRARVKRPGRKKRPA